MPAISYKLSTHAGTFTDISTNTNAVALGMDLPDGTDLLNYFFEPTTAGGTTPTSKKVTTTPSTTAMMATYYEKLDPSEFCFPLGFDFKISGRTVQYFLVSALGGVYFSTEPIREPATS
ncbi:MAG: hypothetical protein K2F84_04115, partial [Bacteroidales bacterium]|nr:hypothetical protein [Bacteroidales bacterium]